MVFEGHSKSIVALVMARSSLHAGRIALEPADGAAAVLSPHAVCRGNPVRWTCRLEEPVPESRRSRLLGQRRPSVLVAHALGAARLGGSPTRRFPAGAFCSPGGRLVGALRSAGSAYFGCGAWFMAA